MLPYLFTSPSLALPNISIFKTSISNNNRPGLYESRATNCYSDQFRTMVSINWWVGTIEFASYHLPMTRILKGWCSAGKFLHH